MHPVIAQRQVVGQHEAGLADPASVQVERRREVVDLSYTGADGPVFELHPHLGRLTVGHMHPERGLRAGLPEDGRRQGARPVPSLVRSPRRIAFRLVSGGDAEARPAPLSVCFPARRSGDRSSPRSRWRSRIDPQVRPTTAACRLIPTSCLSRCPRCDPSVHLGVVFSVSWVCSGPYDAQRRFLLILPT